MKEERKRRNRLKEDEEMGKEIGEKDNGKKLRGEKEIKWGESQERLRNTQRDTERLEETHRVTARQRAQRGTMRGKEKQRETQRD